PLAVLLAIVLSGKALALPLARRQDTGKLAFDVDAGLGAEAELREKIVRHVDLGFAGEHVVVRVAGHDDRPGHVDVAVAAGLVVAEAMCAAGELIETGVEDLLRRGAFAGS